MRPPHLANFLTAAVLGAGGDFVSQRFCEGKRGAEVDWRRLAAFTAFNGVYLGFVSQAVYRSYFTKFPARLVRSKFHGVYAALFDNLVHSPLLYLPTYFVTTGLLRGDGAEEVAATFRAQYWNTAAGCLGFWLPAQTVNFCCVPPAYHVRFMNTLCFLWNVALSWSTKPQPQGEALLLE